jgi:hypothetical protein
MVGGCGLQKISNDVLKNQERHSQLQIITPVPRIFN